MKKRIVSDLDGMRDLEEDWERIRHEAGASVLNSFPIVRCWLSHQDDSCQPRIIVNEGAGEVKSIVPLTVVRYKAGRFPMRTLRLAGNGLKMPSLFHLQPLIRKDDQESLAAAVGGIKQARCQTLFMRYMENVPTVQALLDRLSQRKLVSQQRSEVCPFLRISVDPTAGSESIWQNVRKIRSKLEKQGRVSYHQIKTAEEAEAAMRVHVEQHIERWEGKGGSIMSDPSISGYFIDIGRTVVEKGLGFIFEARIDGEVAGQQLVFVEGDLAYGYRIGINERHKNSSPGHLVTSYTLTQLRAMGVTSFDLGPGNESYKTDMGAVEAYLITVDGLGPSLRLLSKASKLPLVRNIVGRLGIRQTMLDEVNKF
jgi:CelD/BcsL family acetyltransferase involved in cellulose biosynthesis